MPTYQYACTACSHQLEVVQSFTDEPLTECPECQGRLRKLFNSVGIVFKGSGFYRTDSRADSRAGKSESSGGSDKGKSESKGSTSTSNGTGSNASAGSGPSGSASKPASSSASSSSAS